MSAEPILVSACLLGIRCRYDGGTKPVDRVIELSKRFSLVPVCPEQLGGLSTPRVAHERRDGRVVSEHGNDATEVFARGAAEALRIARITGCRRAILKTRSPSCGLGEIYDGTFSGMVVAGNGMTAELLMAEGLEVQTDEAFTLSGDG
jgi:uncharacterized protein YbbK (DUF523 family)